MASQSLGSPPDGHQGFGRILIDSVLNMHGSVDLRVEDEIVMGHGQTHSYTVDTDGVSPAAYHGDLKVRYLPSTTYTRRKMGGLVKTWSKGATQA